MPAPENPGRAGAALLIGVGDYLHAGSIPPLGCAARDARAVARALADPDIGGFPRDRVTLLTDGRARRDRIVRRLSKWLPAAGRGADLVVIYFAGHGVVQRIGPKEEGYLMPHDAALDDVIARGVAMSDLALWIGAIEARAVLVCLDCCHAGNVLPRAAGPRDLELRPAMLEQIAGRGRILIAACDGGEQSVEVPELGHGLFTYHLLKGLSGDGDLDRDGRVGVAELFKYVSSAVTRDARDKYSLAQTPWTSGTWSDDVWVSAPARLRPAAAAPPDVSTLTDAQAQLETADETALSDALREVRRRKDTAGVPLAFRCLAHMSPAVRERARKAVHAIGWPRVTEAVEELARRGDEGPMGHVFEGLTALEAHADGVRLLDRLVMLLRGGLQHRAHFLLEHKQASLDLDRVAAVIRAKQSQYRIERALGAGLFTAAYLAREELTGLEVVVRVLRPKFAAEPLLRSRFLELSGRAVRLVHQNLVLTREVRAFPDDDVYYAVRDYVAGPTLREVLASGRTFEPRQAVAIVRALLHGLTPLHRDGAAHGGVRPSNVFLARGDSVVLGDLSLPPPLGAEPARLSYDYRYAPPEMFRGGGELGPRSDLYALGCVAYELLCGEPPFVADNPYELIARHDRDPILPASVRRPELGSAADRLLGRLLARAPDARFAGLEEALSALDAFEASLGMPAPAAQPSGPPPILGEASVAGYLDRVSAVGWSASGPGPDTLAPDFASADGAPGAALPETFAGRYRIVRLLGRGGMGEVYLATDTALNRQVALKVLRGHGYLSSAGAERFRREALAIAQLEHRNIVPIYDIGEADGVSFYAMRYVEGGSLGERLRNGPMPMRLAASLVEQIARAAHYAHERGIIHRDLKPANILMTTDGTPLVSDFGLAKVRFDEEDRADATSSGILMGTPMYMAPEQAAGGARHVGPVTDVYALGMVMYQSLTGRLPFTGGGVGEMLVQILQGEIPPPRHFRSDLPRDLEAICLKCLQKDPAKRYPSAADLAADLVRFLESEPILATRQSIAWRRSVPGFSRGRTWQPGCLAAAALGAAGLVGALLYVLLR